MLVFTAILLAWFPVARASSAETLPAGSVESAPASALPGTSSHPPTINPYTNEYVSPTASATQPSWWQQYQHYFGLSAIFAGTGLAAIAVIIMRRGETNSKRKT